MWIVIGPIQDSVHRDAYQKEIQINQQFQSNVAHYFEVHLLKCKLQSIHSNTPTIITIITVI
jgi:hypothetical protein